MNDQPLPAGVRALSTRLLDFAPDLPALARELDDRSHGCLLFDSAEGHPEVGRYSYLAARPVWEITAKRDGCEVRQAGSSARPLAHGGFALLKELLDGMKWPVPVDAPVPFTGGLAGYLSYELHELLEPASASEQTVTIAPDFAFARVDWLIAVSDATDQAWLIANGFGATEVDALRAAEDLSDLAWGQVEPHLIPKQERVAKTLGDVLDPADLGLRATTSRAQYLQQVEEIQRRITAGDVYEVCLSQCFEGLGSGDPHSLYEAVKAENPAPMSALMRLGGLDIVSASFERFLKINTDRQIETRPVKGTRPRGASPGSDRELKLALSSSAKDRAENVMAVDVARNDLGRVCDYGSIEVSNLCEVESYRVTHQLVSTVRGSLFDQMGAADAIGAAFPGASMTGAPKIQAMLTIAQLEPVARGIFAGSLLWAGYDGQLDSSIVIRTFVQRADRLSLHVGGAVIADSVPEDEYDETLHKAQGMLRALASVRSMATGLIR